MQVELRCDDLKGSDLLDLGVDWQPHDPAFFDYGLFMIQSRVESDLVVQDKKKLIPDELCDFFWRLTVISIYALDKLHVELESLVGVVVSKEAQILLFSALELL